jgi:hypothetical protein
VTAHDTAQDLRFVYDPAASSLLGEKHLVDFCLVQILVSLLAVDCVRVFYLLLAISTFRDFGHPGVIAFLFFCYTLLLFQDQVQLQCVLQGPSIYLLAVCMLCYFGHPGGVIAFQF